MLKVTRLISPMVVGFAMVLLAPFAHAQDKPTQEDAKQITLKAAALVKEKGVDATREVFHADGEFKHGEIYVNVIDPNGVWLIYPPKPAGEGKSVLEVKDVDGKFIVKDIIALANSRGEGWVDYRWINPATNQIAPKTTYVKAVPERNAIVYVGIYK